jgi:Domain of unknown function (DUF4349)
MTTTWARSAGVIGLVVALGVGCSASSDDGDSSGGAVEQATSGDAATDESSGTGTEEAGAGGGDTAGATPTALELTAQARDVVRTGSMRVTVVEVDDAVPELRSIAAGARGFVADEQVRSDDDAADVTLRVPADGFDRVREAIAELGEVTSQDIQAADVTAEMVDLESRIASQRASVDRVRALLAQSGDVTQLAMVEGELARRETDLETLLGQQRVLADQVALGTLTVHLGEDGADGSGDDAEPAGFRDGLRRGWEAFVAGGRAATAAAGLVLPFAVPAAIAFVLVRRWQRRPRPTGPAEAQT